MNELKTLTLNGQTYDAFVDPVARSLMQDVETALDTIIEIQNELIGGNDV
jgi:hypothetical protein